ncbi:glycosyltransferase family 2 protein [Sulfurovum sp.]|uniref:glycosyltransferase family 2 protein n=1 Tax=Sulfurovum sp. TaxID=1969726 RepID=UPI0035644E37
MKVAIITEAYNESRSIGRLLSSISSDFDIFVVDDGSQDNTSSIVKDYNVNLIKHNINLGQAMGFVTGLKCVLMLDYDFVVHLDSDNQHDPKDIPAFVDVLSRDNDCDVVIGSRIIGSQEYTSFLRRMFLPIFNYFITYITGYNITDYLCGFRAYRCSTLRDNMDIFSYFNKPNYNATEMFLLFSLRNFKIIEIPIHVKKRAHGKSTKGELSYGLHIINSIIRYFLNMKHLKKVI